MLVELCLSDGTHQTKFSAACSDSLRKMQLRCAMELASVTHLELVNLKHLLFVKLRFLERCLKRGKDD